MTTKQDDEETPEGDGDENGGNEGGEGNEGGGNAEPTPTPTPEPTPGARTDAGADTRPSPGRRWRRGCLKQRSRDIIVAIP